MIKGFLQAKGKRIYNGAGEEVLLKGWGLGNWMLQEGYMWKAHSSRFDRPRRIEQVVEELTGKAYADAFWRNFRENYITRADILKLAQLGYNSVRIPFMYRLFMEDGPGVHFKEEGFRLLDNCLSWCEEAGIYAFLDLHGAPGGQTGANIDDCIDDVPRLFIDEDSWNKTIELWKRLAERYKDREVVGGYDLLNEPILPPNGGHGDFDYLIPRLVLFYETAIAEIRRIDRKHLFSIEGAHWATDIGIFTKRFDDNMVLHFHRYAEIPDIACLQKFLDKSGELGIPLWLGESGENINEWYTAIYPLAESLGIGYNLWPWKKMDCTNSPYSINRPAEYQKILDYIGGGAHPGFEKAQQIFDEYLENCKLENCREHPEVTNYVMRRAPFTMRATDFDQCPGKGIAFSGCGEEDRDLAYRAGCGMKLVELEAPGKKRSVFDSQWDRYGLVLGTGEFACYTADPGQAMELHLKLAPGYPGGTLEIGRTDDTSSVPVRTGEGEGVIKAQLSAGQGAVRIKVSEGMVCLERLEFLPALEI